MAEQVATTQSETEILGRKAFYKMALGLAAPIMVQNLISTLVSFTDTFMLGFVGETAMSASSLANQLLMILTMAFFGLMTGVSVLTAQYWGKKDTDTIERVLGLGLRFGIAIAALFFALAFFLPGQVMAFFTEDAETIADGVAYLRIIAWSYLFMGVSTICLAAVRSLEKKVVPTLTYVGSLIINITLNATFIFGLFGAPKLGLRGVAIGTLVARIFECAVCICYLTFGNCVKLRVRYIFAKSGVLMKDFLELSVPSMINDVAWSAASSMFAMILGHLGNDCVAANAVAIIGLNIGAVVCRGVANATTIVVSKELGADRKAAAKEYARRMLRLTIFFAILGGLVILAMIPLLTSLYSGKLTETAIGYLKAMMIMQSYHLLGEGINTCLICGCFRGGGDSKFGMIVDTGCMWLIAVPVMAIAAYVLKLPVVWVYFAMCLDEFEKMIPVMVHYFKFNWLNNVTREKSELEI